MDPKNTNGLRRKATCRLHRMTLEKFQGDSDQWQDKIGDPCRLKLDFLYINLVSLHNDDILPSF